ncbi:TetR/AcrR family transcriptional regulator [soil metagenome]
MAHTVPYGVDMTTRSTPTRTTDDWVTAGFAALADGGMAAVRVEPLAKHLGVTKGSFYWHFADRQALLTALLTRWEATGTEQIITEVDAVDDPIDRLRALVALTFRRDAAYGGIEAGIRAWAMTDPDAADVVGRVDARRVAYTQRLLEDAGVDPAVAPARAILCYRMLVGELAWRGHGGAPLTDSELRELLALVTSPGRSRP